MSSENLESAQAVSARMPKASCCVLAFSLAFCLLSGCGLRQAKTDSEKVLARHFRAVATNGYGAAIADYGAQFFANTTKAEWSNSLAAVSGKLGDYQGYSVIGWRASKRVGPGGGTYVELRCRTSYSKYAADESFTLFKGAGASDYKIVGHQINSPGLLK